MPAAAHCRISLATQPLSIGQAERLHRLMQAAYRLEAQWIGTSDFPPLRRLAQQLRTADSQFWLAEQDGSLCGLAELELASAVPLIAALCVDPAYHRQGVGTALLTHLQAQHAALDVSTATANTPALALYQQRGFIRDQPHRGAEGLELVLLHWQAPAPPG